MRLKYTLGVILIVALHQSNCQRPNSNSEGSADGISTDIVANSVTNLAQKISRAIVSQRSKTEIFSPVSIAGALSLLLLGSGGTTRAELMDLMGFSNNTINFTEIHKGFGKLFRDLVSNDPSLKATVPWRENDTCNNVDYDDYPSSRSSFQESSKGRRQRRDADSHLISVANGVFVSRDLQLNRNYADLASNLYDGEIQQLEFGRDPVGTASIINQWVREKTKNKIQEIVAPNQVNDIPMVLASALYFKAKWESMFIELDTKPRPFYINGRNEPPVDAESMATSGCFAYYDAKELDAKIIGLPYQEGKSTMYILLPNNSNRMKLRSIMQGSFSLQQFNQMIDRMQIKTGTIVMPKMKLESTIGLKEVLISLGLRTVFDPSVSNLSGMTGNSQAFRVPSRRRPTTPKQPEINSPAVSALPNPIVFPTRIGQVPDQNVRFPVGPDECNSINNCNFDKTCNCNLSTPGVVDQRGCHSKPFYIASKCPSISLKSITGASMCLAETYNTSPEQRFDRCSQNGCYFISNTCYCCINKPPPVPTEIPQSQKQEATPENVQPQFEVANRFNPNNPNQQSNKDSIQCHVIRRCSSPQFCQTVTICPYINDQFIQNQRPGNTRYKRQSGNSGPPSMYVGQIIHKVSLDINEEGTEGGAVSTIVIDRISSSFTVRVDGPFLIYLRNDVTKLPLFYGPVYDPRS